MQYHKYSLSELEEMLPWEKDVYLAQLIEYIEVENEKIQLKYIEDQRSSSSSYPYQVKYK